MTLCIDENNVSGKAVLRSQYLVMFFFSEYLLLPSPRCCPLLHWSCPARTKVWSLTVTIVVRQGSCLHLWTTSLASLPHIARDIIISSSSISSDSCLILWTSDSLKVLCLGWPAQRAHTHAHQSELTNSRQVVEKGWMPYCPVSLLMLPPSSRGISRLLPAPCPPTLTVEPGNLVVALSSMPDASTI